ncbi:MAG: hypothetical protein U9R53_12030, partial [Chloroflexota bacterium]|nr:hypothetical protein [Chloroflexota bacterium]
YFSCDLSNYQSRSELIRQLHQERFLYNGLINVVGQEIEGKFLDFLIKSWFGSIVSYRNIGQLPILIYGRQKDKRSSTYGK